MILVPLSRAVVTGRFSEGLAFFFRVFLHLFYAACGFGRVGMVVVAMVNRGGRGGMDYVTSMYNTVRMALIAPHLGQLIGHFFKDPWTFIKTEFSDYLSSNAYKNSQPLQSARSLREFS